MIRVSQITPSVIFISLITLLTVSCMRLAPDHPYDPDSPPELRAPSTLISVIYTSQASASFDYSDFVITLTASEYEGEYRRQANEDGRFRFDGIPPGIYLLNVSGEIDGVLFGIENEEVFLPVGERIEPDFYRITQLD